ncbi:MAG: hypothetical protein GW823_01320 [Bacteroidetes bacterium]|nr:hypothetical protein [Bacteroidota bacterium]
MQTILELLKEINMKWLIPFLLLVVLTKTSLGQTQLSNKVMEVGFQQTKVTDFDGDSPQFSFHIGYGFLKTKKDSSEISGKKFNKLTYHMLFLQVDRISINNPYKYSLQNDRVDYTRVTFNGELNRKFDPGLFKDRAAILWKAGISLTPYFSAKNEIDGIIYNRNMNKYPFNIYLGIGALIYISKSINILFSTERFLLSYFEKPYRRFYDYPLPISGRTFYGFNFSTQYVF